MLRPYLGLELLVLLLLGRPVLVYLLLGLVTGLLDTLCPVLSGCVCRQLWSAQLSSPLSVPSSGLLLGAFIHFWTILEASFSACSHCKPNAQPANLMTAVVPRGGSGYPRSSERTAMLLLLASCLPHAWPRSGGWLAHHDEGRFEITGKRSKERFLICWKESLSPGRRWERWCQMQEGWMLGGLRRLRLGSRGATAKR